MIGDNTLLWFFFLILIVCHDATGNTNYRNNKFAELSTFNGYECSDGFTVDVTNDFVAESVSKCGLMCASYLDCVGFFYEAKDQICLLCNELFNPAGTTSLTILLGSVYYSRSDCHSWIRGNPTLKVYLETVGQSDAMSRCKEDNGTLMKIRDQSQMSPLSDALAACPSYSDSTDYWTDGEKDVTSGTWKYADGTVMPMDSPDFWEVGSPDGHSTEFCTRLRYDAGNDRYRWNDKSCATLYRFICEYNN